MTTRRNLADHHVTDLGGISSIVPVATNGSSIPPFVGQMSQVPLRPPPAATNGLPISPFVSQMSQVPLHPPLAATNGLPIPPFVSQISQVPLRPPPATTNGPPIPPSVSQINQVPMYPKGYDIAQKKTDSRQTKEAGTAGDSVGRPLMNSVAAGQASHGIGACNGTGLSRSTTPSVISSSEALMTSQENHDTGGSEQPSPVIYLTTVTPMAQSRTHSRGEERPVQANQNTPHPVTLHSGYTMNVHRRPSYGNGPCQNITSLYTGTPIVVQPPVQGQPGHFLSLIQPQWIRR